jgi:hypothetical protein
LTKLNSNICHEDNVPLNEFNALCKASYEIGKINLHDFYSNISIHHDHHMANNIYVATLALGSRPRQRELQGCGPKGSPGVKAKRSPRVKPRGCPGVKARGSPGVTSHTPGSVRKC